MSIIVEYTTIYYLIAISATLLVSYVTYNCIIFPFYLSPLKKLPGPPPDHFLLGNFLKLLKSQLGIDQLEWAETYGGIYKYYGLFNRINVGVVDEKILQKILISEGNDYVKPPNFLGFLKHILGEGIFMAEGDLHKKQRKLLTPVFNNHDCVKDMIPVFAKVCNKLKEIWKNEIKNSQDVDIKDKKKMAKIDIMDYMSNAALDAIGIVGFDYEFNSLTSTSELAKAYRNVFSADIREFIFRYLSIYFPILCSLPTNQKKRFTEASHVIDKVTNKLIQEKLDQYLKGELENSRDLISTLIKVNSCNDLGESEKMDFDELKNQIMTFLVAGHETTSAAICWTLCQLAKDQEIQNKLRKEIIEIFPDKNIEPTFDQINSLKYLNAVCKESLRITPPAPILFRASNKDSTLGGYFIPKGTRITIPVRTIHHMPSIWGPDANEFNPDRWFSEKVAKTTMNCNYLPFLTGQRACIGSKVALNEMKVFITILIRNFEFRQVEGFEIKGRIFISYRPIVALLQVKEVDY